MTHAERLAWIAEQVQAGRSIFIRHVDRDPTDSPRVVAALLEGGSPPSILRMEFAPTTFEAIEKLAGWPT